MSRPLDLRPRLDELRPPPLETIDEPIAARAAPAAERSTTVRTGRDTAGPAAAPPPTMSDVASVPASALLASAAQVSAYERLLDLPPAPGSHPPLAVYEHALKAREHRAALAASGQRLRGPEAERPRDVPPELWARTAALAQEGFDAEDVRLFVATGQVRDVVDDHGEVVASGVDRLAELERRATREGAWPAVNALGVLIEARVAALEAQAQARAVDPAGSTAEVLALREEVGVLRAALRSTHAAATTARERSARAGLLQADRLMARAASRRATGDTAGASALEQRAEALRVRSATSNFAEANYRESVPAAGWRTETLYLSAATAQLARGRAVLDAAERARASGVDAPPPPIPAAIAEDATTEDPAGVPGARALITRAEAAAGGPSHASLGLRAEQLGTVAELHALHLPPASAPARPLRGEEVTHRVRYFEVRSRQVDVLEARLDLYGPATALAPSEARTAAEVSTARTALLDELVEVERHATLAARHTVALEDEARALDERLERQPAAEASARAAVAQAREAEARAKAQDKVLIDRRTPTDAARDAAAARDATTLRAQAERTLDGLEQARAALTDRRVDVKVSLAQAELDEASTAQALEARRVALGERRWAGRAGRGGVGPEADREAERAHDYVARAQSEVGVPPAARARDALTAQRLSARWARSAELDAAARFERGGLSPEAKLERAEGLSHAAATSAAATATVPALHQALGRSAVTLSVARAQAEARVRPERAAAALREAATQGLALADLEARVAARREVGAGAVVVVRLIDQGVAVAARRGHFGGAAADDAYRLAHVCLDGDAGAGRGAVAELVAVDDQLARVGETFRASIGQLRAGVEVLSAELRSSGRTSGAQAADALPQLFGVGLGADTVRIAGDQRAAVGVDEVRARGARLEQGLLELSGAWTAARADGRALGLLHGLRASAETELDPAVRAEVAGHVRVGAELGGPMPAWREAVGLGLGRGELPALATLRAPLATLRADALDGERVAELSTLGAYTAEPLGREVEAEGRGARGVMLTNTIGQGVLEFYLTRGLGAGLSSTRLGARLGQLWSAAPGVTGARALVEQHRVVGAMAMTGVAGAVSLGATAVARRTFGAHSDVAEAVGVGMGLMPFGALSAALPSARATERLGAAALVAAQSGAAMFAVSVVGDHVPGQPPELVGLAVQAVLSGVAVGAARGSSRAAHAAARAEGAERTACPAGATRTLASALLQAGPEREAGAPRPAPPELQVAQVARALDAHLARTHGRAITADDTAQARAEIVSAVAGRGGLRPEASAKLEAILGALAQARAAELALGARRVVDQRDEVVGAVDEVAAGLLAARGGSAEPHDRAAAYADASNAVLQHLLASGRVEAAWWAHDRQRVVSLTARETQGLEPAVRANVEGVLAEVYGGLRERWNTQVAEAGASPVDGVRARLEALGVPRQRATQLVSRVERASYAEVVSRRLRVHQEQQRGLLDPLEREQVARDLASRTGRPLEAVRADVEARFARERVVLGEVAARVGQREGSDFEAFAALLPAGSVRDDFRALGAARRAEIFGAGTPPAVAVPLVQEPGFLELCARSPAEARVLVDAVGLFRGQGGTESALALIGRLRTSPDAAGYAAPVAQLKDMVPVVRPHDSVPGLLVVTRGPRSPSWIPSKRVVVTPLYDETHAFQLKSVGSGRTASRPDLRVMPPEQLVVDGVPRRDLDGVLVYSGHGTPRGISGTSPEGVAQLIAAELGDARVVVLESCHQLDGGWTPSSGLRVQRALDAQRQAAGLPPVTVLVMDRPGTIAPTDRRVPSGPHVVPSWLPRWDAKARVWTRPRIARPFVPVGRGLPELGAEQLAPLRQAATDHARGILDGARVGVAPPEEHEEARRRRATVRRP